MSFDGHAFDDSLGWTAGTARAGAPTAARIISLGRLEIPDLANHLELNAADFLAVDRVRCTDQGDAVSIERSRIPWQPSFDSVVASGLIDGSLTKTLLAHGLRGVHGTESVTVASLGTDDAAILGHCSADAFLRTERDLYDVDNHLVEHVVSLLHPDHFALHYVVGQR